MTAPVGIIRLSELAEENGITLRCLKRRLLKLDKRLRSASPNGPFCLVQHGDGAPYCADASVLFLHARGYLHKRLEKAPLEEIRDLLLEIRDAQLETLSETRAVREDSAATRLAVAG